MKTDLSIGDFGIVKKKKKKKKLGQIYYNIS